MVISSISTACRGHRGLDAWTPDLGLVKCVEIVQRASVGQRGKNREALPTSRPAHKYLVT